MNIFFAFEKVAAIFLLIIIGFVFGKIVKEDNTRLLSKLILNIAVPAIIILKISEADYEAVKQDIFALIAISACVFLASLIVGFIFTRAAAVRNKVEAAVYRSAFYNNNFGFLGWPVCAAFFGPMGFTYAVLYSIPMHLLIYTVTPILLCGEAKNGFNFKLLANAPLIATIIGVALLLLKASLPAFVNGILEMAGATQTPLSMFLIGMILAGADLKKVFTGIKPLLYSFFRLLLIPIAVYFILKNIGVSGLVLGVSVVISAMPAGATVSVLTEKYNSDSVLAVQIVIVSTLLSLVTIPVISLLVL